MLLGPNAVIVASGEVLEECLGGGGGVIMRSFYTGTYGGMCQEFRRRMGGGAI